MTPRRIRMAHVEGVHGNVYVSWDEVDDLGEGKALQHVIQTRYASIPIEEFLEMIATWTIKKVKP
jgi:hypothetical protein